MAGFVRKNLGQQMPAANTDTTLYTVPGGTDALVRGTICNQGTDTTIRLAHRVGGAALIGKQYIYYDAPLKANATLEFGPVTAGAGDVFTVRAGHNAVSFNLTGQEFS